MRTAAALLLGALLGALPGAPALAQEPHAPGALTPADYARAERFLGQNAVPLMVRLGVAPTWLGGDRFWYANRIPEGTELVVVDPARGTRERAFDHERLAAALSEAADTTFAAFALPLRGLDYDDDGGAITFGVADRRFACHLETYRCGGVPPEGMAPGAAVSPDGRRAAFIRDHNLWMRDLETGEETRLTTDGVERFGYATDNAGWTRSDDAVLLWSPDSRRIATFQHDARGVGDMTLVATGLGRPEVEQWPYPFPGDSLIFRIERVVIHVDAPGGPRVVRLQMPPDQHRSSVCDHILCDGRWADVEWTEDGSRLVFLSNTRDHKRATLRVADPETGGVRDVFEESEPTFFESGFMDAHNWRVLGETNELLWYSQRDDWGNLYLLDLQSGAVKNRVTEGPWNVLKILRVDPASRTIWFLGNAREPGDPYFHHFYRVGLDGTGLTRLTPDSAHHVVSLSPSGRYFVDVSSTPVTPPVSVLRDAADGSAILELERADISRLVAAGWQPPIPFSVKARDGTTDLFGLMYLPTNMDRSKKYPIINHIYPGPQSGSVGSRSFGSGGSRQALAELGFVVIALDAMGTPFRSKTFHEAYYGNMGDNGLPDQVAGMRELAARHSWIDLDRAGIYGHSGGGYASTGAILRYPEFFDVAVSTSGNHDNRNYEDDWGEKWQGLLVEHPDGTTSYDNQANQTLAANLRGKLLLAHGGMDDNVPPSSTLLLTEALARANKDFDFILFPNARHGYGALSLYMERRRWDYFVRHLLGAEPPREYRILPPGAILQ